MDDIEWREAVIETCADKAVILNPLGGKTYNKATKKWKLHGVESKAKTIVDHDFWCIDRSDIVIFNLLCLSEGYPTIGSLIEFGHATAKKCLIYSIIAPDYKGHQNNTMYKLHPFLEINSSIIFSSVGECTNFLKERIDSLSGVNPYFAGYTNE